MALSPARRRPRIIAHKRHLTAIAAVIAAMLFAAQTGIGATGSSIAIVSNLGGALTVRDSGGISHDVSGAQPLRSGDTAMTGINALASITLSGLFRARLGAGTVAQYYASGSAPALRLSAGALCVAENTAGVTIAAAGTALTAVNTPAVFDITTGHNGTTIVLYSGSVAAQASGSKSNVVRAPAAFAALPGGQFTASPFDATATSIASMPCPDRDSARSTMLALQSPTPGPDATIAPSSGGGGGGGVLGILAGIAGLAALAGHGGGGGGGGSNPPPPLPSPSPGALHVAPTSLSFMVGGAAQTVTATETNYSGQLTASSPNPAIATVSPASGPSGVVFTVTPVGPGSTSFNVADNHGGSVAVSISVATPGHLTVSPLDFQTQPINSPPLLLKVSESNYSGPFTVTSDHLNIVTIGGSGHGPGPVTFTVTPAGQAGKATITVADSQSNSVKVPITIAGPIIDNPNVLNAITGPTTFMTTDAFYTGVISASSDNDSVATVSGGGNGPGPVTFTVTPHVQGNAVITVTDTLLQTATVPVSVSTGGLVLNPTSLTFNKPVGESLTFNATEPNYIGNITPSGCSTSIVTVSPTVGTGPSQDFTVKSVGPGNCTITVATGDHTADEAITVFGDLIVSPTSLTYTDVNVTLPVDVSEANYTGQFSINGNTCAGIANVGNPSSGGPHATINVTSSVSLSGGSCSFQVGDDHGGAQPVFVKVGPFGSPAPSPANLTLNTVNHQSDTISVSESNYSGQFGASSSDCTGIATFPSGMATSFLITEVGAGTCHINFADDHGQSASSTIVVDGALVLTPNPINFTDGPVISPVAINEPNYTGNFSITNDNCAGVVATVGTPAGPGPSTSVNVTSLTHGSCQFNVIDTDGQSVQEMVSVDPLGQPTPSIAQMNLNTAGPLTGTFTISESGYTGNFTLTPSSACTPNVGVSPGTGNQSTTFTVTANAVVVTCGIRILDDLQGASNVEVEVSGGTLIATPASLFFPTTTSPEQDVTATDPGATVFGCVSSDPGNVTALITVQNTGSATCAVTPTNANPSFQGTVQVTFGDNFGSNTVVQVGVVLQPLSKIHRVVPGGVKRPLPHGPRPVVPPVPLPKPGGQIFNLSAQQVMLAANARQTIVANVFDYRGALVASSSSPNVADVMVILGSGPIRSIMIVAKSPGSAVVRIADERGNTQSVRVVVISVSPGHLGPGGRPGGPP